jgi:hypothetical protein
MRAALRIGALCAVLAVVPVTAQAQAAPPTFACQTRALLVGAAEMNGLRVHCSVSGAPEGDQVLRVLGAQPLPICEVNLNNGSGDCVGSVFTSDGQRVVAVLEPSGTQSDVLSQQPPEAQPALQYTPIPPDESGGSAP